jgi:hypothetical protein
MTYVTSQAQRRMSNSFTGINGSVEVNYYGIYVAPSITIDYKKHTFAGGPLFNAVPYYYIIPKKPGYYYPTKDQFIGGRFSYDNHFFSKRKLNLFFNLNLTYHHNVFSEFENYSSKVVDPFYENRSEFLALGFGLGNNIYYPSGVYLHTCLGWGATLYEKLGPPPAFSIPDRGYLSNTMIIRIGVGYFF